jgi:serine/threonine-protein kinase
MGELKSNGGILTVPVNTEKINQLFEEEEIPWDDYDEPAVSQPQRRNGGIKKVQDYDDDDSYNDYDYDNDGDGDLDPKLKKGVMIAGIASAVVIAIIILVLLGNLAGWFKFGSRKNTTDASDTSSQEEQVEEVDMINVVGYTQDKAVELLEKLGLTNVTVQTEENTDVQEGYVFDQSVKENTKIKTDFEVILKVASAAEQIAIPDVTNYTDDQAKTVLEEAGFVVAHSYEYSDEVDADKVIRTEPAANTQAEKGSKVIMVMSNGSEVKETIVPSITGMTEAQAINALNTAKLSVGAASHQYDDNVKQGYVISQSLAKDTKVDEGTSVDYVISDGPEPKTTTYTANITARLTAPTDGSLDGQAVTVQVVYNGNVIYEAPINSITSGSAYDVNASQPGLSDQSGQGSVVVKDASGNDVTSAFAPSVNTSFTAATQ